MRRSISLLFWPGKFRSSWLLPDLADVLFLEDVVLSHVVTKCGVAAGRPAFMGGLSPALYRLIDTGPPCRNVTNIGIDKTLAPPQDFTDFCQTLAVNISAPRRPYQKLVKAKSNHHHCPISVFLLMTSIQRPSQRSTTEPLSCPKWGMGEGGEGGKRGGGHALALITSR